MIYPAIRDHARCRVGSSQCRDQSLERVEDQDHGPPFPAQYPPDIGGPDITAAVPANIVLQHESSHEETKRNSSNQNSGSTTQKQKLNRDQFWEAQYWKMIIIRVRADFDCRTVNRETKLFQGL